MPPPKPPSRDRDDRQTIKPPSRVLEQIASSRPERGDATPIESPPSKLNPDRPAESRAQVQDLDILREEIKGWVHVDEIQHEEIRKTVETLGAAVIKLDDRGRESEKNQANLMLETRAQSASLNAQSLSLNALVEESNMSKEKKQALEIAQAQSVIRTQEHAVISRRDLKYYLVRGVVGIAIGAITLLIEHAFK